MQTLLHGGQRRILLLLALALTVTTLRAETPASRRTTPRPDLVFVQAAVVQAGDLLQRFPEGSRIVRLDRGSLQPLNLTAGFFAAADPQVSFDGSKILFAAKEKTASSWQIWEMQSDGSAKRQLTHCQDGCLRPAYLPRDAIVFTAVTGKAGAATVTQLCVGKRDGTEIRPITFGPGDYEVETVLQNGLILASARSPLLPAGGGQEARELYTLRPDGSGLAPFRCDHQQPAVRGEAAELDDGTLVFVKRPAQSPAQSGELAMVRRGALHNSRLGNSPVIAYSPRPLGEEKLSVARRAPGSSSATGKLDLYAYDTAQGKFAGPIYQDPKLSSLAAVPVAAHTPPRWYWSTLNPELAVGYFICLDAYRSGPPARAGEAPEGLAAGSLSRVRVLALEPATQQERSLGEAPIEKDGSFYIAVPPDRPVRFELLDASGRVVRAQRSWIWTRPGEEHGCVGCHEDRAVAPENRWPLALRRFDTPARLTGFTTEATKVTEKKPR